MKVNRIRDRKVISVRMGLTLILPFRRWQSLSLLTIALSVVLTITSCGGYKRNKTYAAIPEASVEAGEKLAAIHCQSCHELPDPGLLDVASWQEGVLPQMAPRLGIFKHNFRYYPSFKKDRDLDSSYYPARPAMTAGEWQALMDYYLATSPDSMPPQQRKPIANKSLPFFSVDIPSYRYDTPALSFIRIVGQPAGKPRLLFNDITRQNLYSFNALTIPADSLVQPGNIVDIEVNKNEFIFCDIGQLNPTNAKLGNLRLGVGDSLRTDSAHLRTVAGKLARPVAFTSGDLNKDGLKDFVVCEFGNLTGSLSWIEANKNGSYNRHVLTPQPGAVKAYITDHNHDGLPDIWALFAQGDESVIVYTNLGNGRFYPEKVLTFPPVYGSSFFELADFNNDGFQDIVYTAGDNADFSMVLKPYHGVYIFLNDGKNSFSQKFFFEIHGCFKALARDFDKDGDLDLAAISFFADYEKQPEEGFVYLENRGNFKFEPYTFPQSRLGRWLTMDAGDFDGDGNEDIVLGNFSVRPSDTKTTYDWKKGPPFILLRNLKKAVTR